jgi:hypothetical protein
MAAVRKESSTRVHLFFRVPPTQRGAGTRERVRRHSAVALRITSAQSELGAVCVAAQSPVLFGSTVREQNILEDGQL